MDGQDLNDISGMGLENLENLGDATKNNIKTPEQLEIENKAKQNADKLEADKVAVEKATKDAAELKAKELAEKEEKSKTLEPDGNKPPEAVEIEGIKYKLDDKGNALDDKGAVFKTKEQLDQMESDDLEPLPQVIVKKLGYEVLDNKGKPKIYEDSEEGLVESVKDIANVMLEKYKKDFLESDPEFKEFVDYKSRGGKLEDFVQKKTSSWKSVKLDENNNAQLESVIMADLLATGIDKIQAEITIGLYKDSKNLKDFGKAAYNRLVSHEDQVEKEEKEQFEIKQKEYEEKTKNHWSSMKTVIDTGNLKGIVIPESEKEAFYKYIAIAVDNKGNSQMNLDRLKLPPEQLLQLDYYQFKGFDLSKLIKDAANNVKVKGLRDRISKNRSSGVGDGEGADKKKFGKPNDLNITVDDLTSS